MKGPFKSREEVENYFNGDRIQCLICYKWFKSLGLHIKKKHDTTVEQYKDRFGLPSGHGLCCCKTTDKFRDNAETYRAKGQLLTGFISKEHREGVHKCGPRRAVPFLKKERAEQVSRVGAAQNKYSVLDFEECWRLFRGGLTQKEIGAKFGVSQMTVSRFMRKANKYQ